MDIECVINKIKLSLIEENEEMWDHIIDNQEMGDCQSIVSGIKRMNINGVKTHFGEIEILNPIEEEYSNKIMTHHWVTYNGEVLEFSKGTLKEFVDFSDIYDPIEEGSLEYNEMGMKYEMNNIKTYEGFMDLFKSDLQKRREELFKTKDRNRSKEELEEFERKKLEDKTKRSISLAQRNGDPTYYDHVTKTTEATPNISSRKQSLRNVRKGLKR